MSKNECISTFYSDDNTRIAEIYQSENNVYYVKLYENIMPVGLTLINVLEFPEKSLRYVEDAAENYVTWILS